MNWRRTVAWMMLVSLACWLGCGNPPGERNVKDNTTDITSEEAP